MKTIQFLSFLSTLLLQTINSLVIYNTFKTKDSPQYHLIDISNYQNDNIISIRFNFTSQSQLLSIFVMASDGQYYTNSSINSTTFYGKSQKDYLSILDLQNMQMGKPQYINIIKQQNFQKLYLSVFDLDQPDTNLSSQADAQIKYQISVQQSTSFICPQCENGDSSSDKQSCQCINCSIGFTGYYCDIQLIDLHDLQQKKSFFAQSSIVFYQIPIILNPFQVTIKTTADSGPVSVYLQQINAQNQFACLTNNNLSISKGQILIRPGQTFSLYVNSTKVPISLSLAQYDKTKNKTVVPVQLKTDQLNIQQSAVFITLGIIVVVILVLIILGICYLIKHPTLQQTQSLKFNEQNLNAQQIQKYFPSFTLRLLEQSDPEIKQNDLMKQQAQSYYKDCSRCLSQIHSTQKIKLTYCLHIFHQKCFKQIFIKTKKCPRCLKLFSKQKTLQAYQKLCFQMKVETISSVELGKQLLIKKKNCIKKTVFSRVRSQILSFLSSFHKAN